MAESLETKVEEAKMLLDQVYIDMLGVIDNLDPATASPAVVTNVIMVLHRLEQVDKIFDSSLLLK